MKVELKYIFLISSILNIVALSFKIYIEQSIEIKLLFN